MRLFSPMAAAELSTRRSRLTALEHCPAIGPICAVFVPVANARLIYEGHEVPGMGPVALAHDCPHSGRRKPDLYAAGVLERSRWPAARRCPRCDHRAGDHQTVRFSPSGNVGHN